ncbi:MAG: hypothetical protein WA137_06470 [Methanothrix sp.]
MHKEIEIWTAIGSSFAVVVQAATRRLALSPSAALSRPVQATTE